MPISSFKVSQRSRYAVWQLGSDLAESMTDFVHSVYERRFSGTSYWRGNEYAEMLHADQKTFSRSYLYCAYDDSGTPLATVRAIRKCADEPLPTEKDFSVDFISLGMQRGTPPEDIYEIGRLAKDGQAMQRAGIDRLGAVGVVEDLIAHVIRATSYDHRNLWVASIDQMVLMLLRSRGYGFEAVGPTVDYLGSPTTPVMLPVAKWQAAQPGYRSQTENSGTTERPDIVS